jgi:hypothetical protein
MAERKMAVLLRDYSNPDQPKDVEATIVALDRTVHLRLALAWQPLLRTHGEEDGDWDWSRWIAEADQNQKEGRGEYESYALLLRQELQALMLIELRSYNSWESGQPLVYVEYVSVAPANRRTIQRPPRLGGCGTVIKGMAIERSLELGYGGKIGLHSLPKAVEIYERMGMRNFGLDPREGLHYFES